MSNLNSHTVDTLKRVLLTSIDTERATLIDLTAPGTNGRIDVDAFYETSHRLIDFMDAYNEISTLQNEDE